jgi:hypothetical protein
VYPPGRYPYRHFGLDLVVQAVATSAFGGETTLAMVGRRFGCSGRSISRWARWVAGITDIPGLARECLRLDPDAMPVAARSHGRTRAGSALAVLDRFASVLERAGVLDRGSQPSLARLLDDQRLRHGIHFPLCGPSPPLSAWLAEPAGHGQATH